MIVLSESAGAIQGKERYAMKILFCGDSFIDAVDYLRKALPADADDEILVHKETSHRTWMGST
jgi:hypothetical protein